jgi:hypothetical protein
MYGTPFVTCFKYQVHYVPLWFRSHHIFELFTLSGYRAMPPPPTTGSPSPNGSKTLTHLEENLSVVKLPYLC